MVKGITRQVIVVNAPDPKLFEQAFFIVKEDAPDLSEEALLREAKRAVHEPDLQERKRHIYLYGAFWAAVGAAVMGALWLAVWLLAG